MITYKPKPPAPITANPEKPELPKPPKPASETPAARNRRNDTDGARRRKMQTVEDNKLL
ncbi:hypothetical protein [Mesorhizobium sp. CAU 1732]|uniref:hypothetical protein n=1 Tax=Mesorhizobium sp. CAU 1732 TaxID=3140358 RepID=UPI00326128F8